MFLEDIYSAKRCAWYSYNIHQHAGRPHTSIDCSLVQLISVASRDIMWCELYNIERELGRGRFGVVVRAVEKTTGDCVAIKVLAKQTRGGRDQYTTEREVQALRIARGHPRLLQLFDVLETTTQAALVLELVEGGELFDYLAKKDMFIEKEAVVFTRQLIDGLAYLHDRMVVHLDIKPENILLVEEGSVHSIKIIDFGLARVLKKDEPQFETHGTPEFVAPEIVRREPVTTSTDMWAVGVTTYILLSGISPFLGETDRQTFHNIRMGCYDINEDFEETEVSPEAEDFIECLLASDPSERLTAEMCLRHPWIKEGQEGRRDSQISTDRLRKFNARRKWHSVVQVVQASWFLRQLSRERKLRNLSSPSTILPMLEAEESGSSCASSETESDDTLASPVGACVNVDIGSCFGVRKRSLVTPTSPLLFEVGDSREQMQELTDELQETMDSLKQTSCPAAARFRNPISPLLVSPDSPLLMSPDSGVDVATTLSRTSRSQSKRRHSTGNAQSHRYSRKESLGDWSCTEDAAADSHWRACSTKSVRQASSGLSRIWDDKENM